MHDFDLAESYFEKAKMAGANNRTVQIGLTNTYLAEGNTRQAEEALASLGPAGDYHDDYDYMMASANSVSPAAGSIARPLRVCPGEHGEWPTGSRYRGEFTILGCRSGRPSGAQRQFEHRARGVVWRIAGRHQRLHARRKDSKSHEPGTVAAAAAFISESGRVPLSRALGELARHHRLRRSELYRGSVPVPQ